MITESMISPGFKPWANLINYKEEIIIYPYLNITSGDYFKTSSSQE